MVAVNLFGFMRTCNCVYRASTIVCVQVWVTLEVRSKACFKTELQEGGVRTMLEDPTEETVPWGQ